MDVPAHVQQVRKLVVNSGQAPATFAWQRRWRTSIVLGRRAVAAGICHSLPRLTEFGEGFPPKPHSPPLLESVQRYKNGVCAEAGALGDEVSSSTLAPRTLPHHASTGFHYKRRAILRAAWLFLFCCM